MYLLKEKTFEEITVDEICQRSEISRGTFFNYFPQKSHIFYYYMRIFTIKIMQRMRHWDVDMPFKEQMAHIYKWFDEENQFPNFVSSYIDYLLEEGSSHNKIKLTEAEFVYFFTGIETEEDYEYYNNLTIEGIIKEIGIKAKERGEISASLSDDYVAKVFLIILVGPFITHKGLTPHANPRHLFEVVLESFITPKI